MTDNTGTHAPLRAGMLDDVLADMIDFSAKFEGKREVIVAWAEGINEFIWSQSS